MDATELAAMLAQAQQARDTLITQRRVLDDGVQAYEAMACEPGYPPQEQQQFRRRAIDARDQIQRIDLELFSARREIRRLEAERDNANDAAAAHASLFNSVRQVVATSNVQPIDACHTSPEVA